MTALGLISSHSHLDFRSQMKNGRGCDLFNSSSYTKTYTQESSQHQSKLGRAFLCQIGLSPNSSQRRHTRSSGWSWYLLTSLLCACGDNALSQAYIYILVGLKSVKIDYGFIYNSFLRQFLKTIISLCINHRENG